MANNQKPAVRVVEKLYVQPGNLHGLGPDCDTCVAVVAASEVDSILRDLSAAERERDELRALLARAGKDKP